MRMQPRNNWNIHHKKHPYAIEATKLRRNEWRRQSPKIQQILLHAKQQLTPQQIQENAENN